MSYTGTKSLADPCNHNNTMYLTQPSVGGVVFRYAMGAQVVHVDGGIH